MNFLIQLFGSIRNLIITVLLIALPLLIYLGFIREDPLFEPEYDIEIGRQSVLSIQVDSIENPLLSFEEYPEAYNYMRKMVKEITSSESVQYANLFKYDSVRIIQRDDILNAFCTPGGYIYVYTGLIKYLDHPDHLAGVLAHEIAHAELRHSAVRLQKEFGREKILDFVILSGTGLGGYAKASILSKILTLNYSRDQEAAADENSVLYLKDTRYACDGCGGFFVKLTEQGDEINIPEILSDHPDSKKRIRDIQAKARSLQCKTLLADDSDWLNFQKLLPQNDPEEEEEEEQEQEQETL